MALRRAAVWLGLAEHEEQDLYDEQVAGDAYPGEEDADGPGGQAGAAGQAGAGAARQIATVRPETFQDALTIGEYFRQDVPVIINLHDMDTPDAKRIVDFASGLIFGRRGSIERISGRVFLILPPAYQMIAGQGALDGEGFFNQA
jgi:cell division inhibitor SepF